MKSITFILGCFFYHVCLGQPHANIPYGGGIEALEKEIQSSFLVESENYDRILFAEISINKKSKKVETTIHGIINSSYTTSKLIASFFDRISTNWNIKFLKKRNVVIPLFIGAFHFDNINSLDDVDMKAVILKIAESFNSKNCFLVKPIFVLGEATHVEIEQ